MKKVKSKDNIKQKTYTCILVGIMTQTIIDKSNKGYEKPKKNIKL